MHSLILKSQETPLDDPLSNSFFNPIDKPFVATPTAIDMYGEETIMHCLNELRSLARFFDGLDYLQVYTDGSAPRAIA